MLVLVVVFGFLDQRVIGERKKKVYKQFENLIGYVCMGLLTFCVRLESINILQIKRCVLMGYFWIKVKIVFEFF